MVLQRAGAPRRILRVGLRLSVVVGALSGLADAYNRYSATLEAHKSNFNMRVGYECAAKSRDEDLLRARNIFGNINVRGAPFYCAERDFWVAMYEIEKVRNGTMDFSVARQWFDWRSTTIPIAIGFVLTNILALLIAGTVVVVRWVLRPISG